MSLSAGKDSIHWLTRLGSIERWLCAIAFAVLTLCIFSDVLLRELFGNGIHWAQRIALNANVLLVFAGIGLATANDEHLRPRIFDHVMPDSWDPLITRLQQLLMSLFCLAVAVIACVVVYKTWALAERDDVLGWPIWPLQSLIPVAFVLASIRHFVYFSKPSLVPVRDTGPSDKC